jgi:hypothetical protein
MKTKYTLTLFVLAALTALTAFKLDDDPFSLLLKKMETYNKNNIQEKVHLHLDKPFYAIGDDIWFKAYVVNTFNGKPSNISNVLYVELISETDSIKKQLSLPLMGGISWGDFKLTDSLSEGNYRIRAYTRYMRNAGAEFMFDKTIKIGNAWANKVFTKAHYTYEEENNSQKVNTAITFVDKNGAPYASNEVSYAVQLNNKNISKGKVTTNAKGEANFNFVNNSKELDPSGKITATLTLDNKQKITKIIPITATSNSIDVQFFPEGGNLIDNLPIRVAFKAVNAQGQGKDISGIVVDQTGTEITKFNSTYLGMGQFILNPQPGNTYKAVITHTDGSTKTVDLPKSNPVGYSLQVNNADSTNIQVKVFSSESLISSGELKLVAQNQGTTYAVARIKTQKQISNLQIPKKELPSGITQLTLFDAENNPVAERLVFIMHQKDNINLTATSEKKVYKKREKVTINLNAALQQKPVYGSFSVSVTNTSVVKPDLDNESNIFTTLLLTSDLQGYIEKPNHYFLNQDAATLQQLDNLMLTQGWRRFIWKNVINNTPPVTQFSPQKSLAISGTLVTLGGKPVAKGKVSLFSSSRGLLAIDTLTDENGRFSFDKLIFPDSTKFLVQGRTGKDRKNIDIKLDIVPGQLVTKNKNTGDIEVNVNEAISSYVKRSSNYFDELTKRGLLERTIMLDVVNITEKRRPTIETSNLNGSGNADAVITAEQLSNCITLLDCLQGRVAGLIVIEGIPYLSRTVNDNPMQVIIDGMQVESDFLDAIQPQDVQTIEVLKSAGNLSIYGSQGSGGILIITTKRGDGGASSARFSPGIITYSPKGYSYTRQFYSPNYETLPKNNASDLRTTIYWNPQVLTSTEGKATFNYFNSDEAGTYRVVIEGINITGQLARTTYIYEVK